MGLVIIFYRAAYLSSLVPAEIKQSLSLSTFKERMKMWDC